MSGFDQPPIPSSFDAGIATAGHTHIDSSGMKLYGPDGTTALFDFEAGAGTLSLQGTLTAGNLAGGRVVIDGNGPNSSGEVLTYNASNVLVSQLAQGKLSLYDSTGVLRGALLGAIGKPPGYGANIGVLTINGGDGLVVQGGLFSQESGTYCFGADNLSGHGGYLHWDGQTLTVPQGSGISTANLTLTATGASTNGTYAASNNGTPLNSSDPGLAIPGVIRAVGLSSTGQISLTAPGANNTTNAGHLEIYNPAGNRLGYMGWDPTDLHIHVSNGAGLRVYADTVPHDSQIFSVFTTGGQVTARVDNSGNTVVGCLYVNNTIAGNFPGIVLMNAGGDPGTSGGGGVLYTLGGALKFKGGNGTVTTIANA